MSKTTKSTKEDLLTVWDAQQQKHLEFAPKNALHLATAYPSRFQIVKSPEKTTGDKVMPKLPQENKPLSNGLHTLVSISVHTTQGNFGAQEEVQCVDVDNGQNCLLWITHTSRKKIVAAAEVGLVELDPGTEEWHVVEGARFQVVAAAGKIVSLLPAGENVPQAGTATN